MHAVSLFSSSFDHFLEGAVWEIFLQGKTPRFSIQIAIFYLGRYLHVLKSPSLCATCFQTDYSLNSQVATATNI